MKDIGKTLSSIMVAGLVLLLGISIGYAAIPYTINYQGYLTHANDGAPFDGPISMTFSLYAGLNDPYANYLWRETQTVNVSNGAYSVILGSVNTLGILSFDIPYYLSVKVGNDAEMLPRVELTSVGYAFTADNADTVDGKHGSDFVSNAGGTMTGTLTLPLNGLVAGTNQLVLVDGKIGIGTATPAWGLHVIEPGYYQAIFESTNSSGGIQLRASGGQKYELQSLNDGGFILYDRNDGREVWLPSHL